MISLVALMIAGSPLAVVNLECESTVNPMNVDVERPLLSWTVTSKEDGQKQTAYQIQVGRQPNKADLWDSGRIQSSNTIDIPYSGLPIESAERVSWKVRTWDAHGRISAWSAPSSWTMGLLHRADWKAHWVGPQAASKSRPIATVFLRSTFQSHAHIKRALCFVSGLGQYEMWINGSRVGNDWLTPGWTQYSKTVLSDCYDVTSMMATGANAIGIHLGNGMYDMSGDTRGGQQPNRIGPQMAICQLMLEYVDGSKQTVASDGAWKWAPSPETYSGVFGGEDWDERLDEPGWKAVRFDDRKWMQASILKAPNGILRGMSHAAPPLRVIEIRHAVRSSEPKPNTLVLDLGQNAPYVPQISVHGPAGTTVTLWPAELLKSDGTVDQETMRAGKHARYVLGGHGTETWRPSFWYVGSQFWQIETSDRAGRPIDPRQVLDRFDGLMVHAAIRPTGTFACSNTLFNRIHDLIWWAMCSNFSSVISDCPHREKSGWLEEDLLMGPSLMYSFDMSTMFRKVIEDIRDTQQADGMVPTMAPEYFHYDGGFRDSVEWGGAYLLLPQFMRDWYGNQQLVGNHYETMKRYVDYLGTRAHEHILANGLGDWNGYGNDPRTPVAITDTAYYYKLIETLRSFAEGLGRTSDAAHYSTLGSEVKESFLRTFYDRGSGKVGTGSQSAQATALDLDLIDPTDQHRAFAQLLADVETQNYSVSCGEVGHPSLLRVLTRFGRTDWVAKIHLQTTKPGYGYQIKKGLTTLAESWDARPISLNHFMLGHIMEWLYADLVGIQPDPSGLGFSKITIKPQPVTEVTWAKGSYDSIRGRINCAWRTDGSKFHMEIDLPANTTATVWVPAKLGSTIRLAYPHTESLGVVICRQPVDGYEPIPVTSGQFVFDSTLK